MKLLKNKRDYIVIFFIFCLLSMLFVYSGDDWMWVSNDGKNLLKEGFKYYNGRFCSNILAIILTHFNFLKYFVYGLSMCSFVYVVNKIFKKNNSDISFLILFLFLIIDLEIFRQGYVWCSAFVNYFLSGIFLLYLIYLIISDKLNKISPLKSFIYSFIFSLFLENVTIILLVFNIFLLFWNLIKHEKKFNKWFFIGNLIGFILMFINIIFYPSIYNNRVISFESIFTFISFNLNKIYTLKYQDFSVFTIIYIISIIRLIYINKNTKLTTKIILIIGIILTGVSFFTYNKDLRLLKIILIIFGSIIYIYYNLCIIDFKNCKYDKFFWLFCTKTLYILPLIITNSLGPRALLLPYMINMIIIAQAYLSLKNTNKLKYIVYFLFAITISSKFISYKFSYDKAQNLNLIIKRNLECNKKVINIDDNLITRNYWFYAPIGKYFQKYYIEFYDINTDVKEFSYQLNQ